MLNEVLAQKVDVVGYPPEPLRVEVRTAPMVNVAMPNLPLIFSIALGAFVCIGFWAVTFLRDIRDALKDLKPEAPVSAGNPTPPK